MTEPMHHFRLFGLAVSSEVALPDLSPTAQSLPPDVVIRRGSVPRPAEEVSGIQMFGGSALLNIPEAGRFLVTAGREIVVEPAAGASDRNVRLYLLGSAFGAILHQRGLLPLHANVIDFGGVAVAFMGHSGAGKSTLANWFRDQGLPILGDDVCVVRPDGDGQPLAEPGLPRIRLWRDALTASGRRAEDFEASFDDMDKYDVPTADAQARQPVRLGAVYVLEPAPSGDAPGIDRIGGAEAVHALVANTYRGTFLPLFGGVERHLAQCVALSRQVPVFALQRRWGLDVFAAEAARVEAHVRRTVMG